MKLTFATLRCLISEGIGKKEEVKENEHI